MSVYQTASKIVACWSERKLTTVLQHKAPRRQDLIGHWTKENSFPLGGLAVNHRRSLLLVAIWGPGPPFWLKLPSVLRTGLIHNGECLYCATIGCFLEKARRYWLTRPRARVTTPSSDSSHAPLPRSFALYNSDWLSLKPPDWSDSHAAFLVWRGKTYGRDTRPLFPGAA